MPLWPELLLRQALIRAVPKAVPAAWRIPPPAPHGLFGAALLALGAPSPTHPLWEGLLFGLATSLLPWFVLLPAFGWGWPGRSGPRDAKALLASPPSHIPYGLRVGAVMAPGSGFR